METNIKLTDKPWFLLICTWIIYLGLYPLLLFLIEKIESDLDFVPIILLPVILMLLIYFLCKFTAKLIWRDKRPKLSILYIVIAIISQLYIAFVYLVFISVYLHFLIGGPIKK